MSVVSPYIDTFSVLPKAKRVNKCPGLDLHAGYEAKTDANVFSPTDVYLGDAPKLLYHVMPRKVPIAYPTHQYLKPVDGFGKVPLYDSQMKTDPVPNHNHFYAPEFKCTKLNSGWEQHLVKFELETEHLNRHKHLAKEEGGYSLEHTPHEVLVKLIRNL